jgi:uncharacterized protein (DUF1684 family)
VLRDTLDLADFRRRVADLYSAVRHAEEPRAAWLQWRAGRDELFRRHPQSPIPQAERSGFAGSPFFDYDERWRLRAIVEPTEPELVMIDHSDAAAPTRFSRVGTAVARLDGESIALDLYWLDAYAGGLFLPFRDGSNGLATYGGGRYLLDSAKGADLGSVDDELILDFNFAYHPSCVWDPSWSCPLAPPANRLDLAVPAGERLA